MLLVNALYFKAEWTEPFDPDNTRPGPFMRLDGTQKQVPFMFRRAHLQVLVDEGVRGVRLPYGDGRLALYAIVPDRWDGFVAGLTAERWEGWLKGFETREVRLSVPRVKLTYQAELLEPLKAMGMERAADPKRADFSGLFARLSLPVYVGRVVQKTYLAIDEQGTEAAAATAVEALGGSAPPRDQPLELRLDRPFLLAIRDDVTGVILFVGVVVEP
jgi:serpin B